MLQMIEALCGLLEKHEYDAGENHRSARPDGMRRIAGGK